MGNELVCVDLGSNSFRVVKYNCKEHKIIDDFHQIVGLADGLIQTGKISNEALLRLEKAIFKSIKKLNYKPQLAICITTAAMRKASNSKEILQIIKNKTKLAFKIIDGNEEARLTLLAIKYALKREKIHTKKFILLDIGGGSTELAINNKNYFYTKSFDFGIVTLAQKYEIKDLLLFLEEQKEEIKRYLKTLKIDLSDFTFIATAGTPTTIAAIKLGQHYSTYDKNVVNGSKLSLENLDECLKLFETLNEEALIRLVGKGRIDFVEVGIYIYKSFFEVLGKNSSLILDDGLREGIAINECLKDIREKV